MKKATILMLLAAALLAVGMNCLQAGAPSSEARSLASRNRKFAIALYKEIGKIEGNVFFSPYGASTSLAMTYAGARGRTAEQMAAVLRFEGFEGDLHPVMREIEGRVAEVNDREFVELRVANSLWPRVGHPLLAEYLELISENYGADVTQLDFAGAPDESRLLINKWVSDETKGRIKNLIPEGGIDFRTALILANAVYFKGEWKQKFRQADTEIMPFHVSPEDTVWVPMMSLEHEFRYGANRLAQVLSMPYAGHDVSMIALLPMDGVSLDELESSLTAESIGLWVMATEYIKVRVSMPRFRFESSYRLDRALADIGMKDAFDARRADFSGMDGRRPNLFISAVHHKGFIEVNEEGTEAAAATAVELKTIGITPGPTVFHADRPFLFIIWESATSSILFMGRVADPSKST